MLHNNYVLANTCISFCYSKLHRYQTRQVGCWLASWKLDIQLYHADVQIRYGQNVWLAERTRWQT